MEHLYNIADMELGFSAGCSGSRAYPPPFRRIQREPAGMHAFVKAPAGYRLARGFCSALATADGSQA